MAWSLVLLLSAFNLLLPAATCPSSKYSGLNTQSYINQAATKTAHLSNTHSGIKSFMSAIDGAVDLLVLMDRSYGLNRHMFYLSELPIIRTMLQHHAVIAESNVHVELVTFARSVETVVNGITGSPINKCQLMEGQNSTWSNLVYRNGQEDKGTNIMEAFKQAVDVLEEGKARRQDARQVLLVVTDGSYSDNKFPDADRQKLLNMGVTIYSMSIGVWSTYRTNMGNVIALASNSSFHGSYSQWIDSMISAPPLTSYKEADMREHAVGATCPPGHTRHCNVLTGFSSCVCDNSTVHKCLETQVPKTCNESICKNGGTCVDSVGDFLCWCPLGYHGRYCQLDQDECALPNVCEGNATCSQGPNYFECTCLIESPLCGCYCQDCPSVSILEDNSGTSNLKPRSGLDLRMWLAIMIPVGLFLLTVMIGSAIILKCLKKDPSLNREQRTNGILALHEAAPTSPQPRVVMVPQFQFQGDTLPSAPRHPPPRTPLEPPQRRPDIVIDVTRPTRREDDEDVKDYQNLPVESGMASWMDYVCDIVEDGGLERVCIVHIERACWIASAADFLMSHDEIIYFSSLFEDRFVGIQIKLKGRWYQLMANDGVTLHCEDSHHSEIVIVARTNHYLILATNTVQSNGTIDICKIEVDWMRNCIREQGG